MRYEVGTILNVDGEECEVIGYIVYQNSQDEHKQWIDYRLRTSEGEHWLSCDEHYEEYSLSWPSSLQDGVIDPKWHKVDEGIQVVVEVSGDVDAEEDDRATFVEFEDETEEETLSLEMWEDGTEVSEGYYLDKEEIRLIKASDRRIPAKNGFFKNVGYILFIGMMIWGFVDEFLPEGSYRSEPIYMPVSIHEHIQGNPGSYVYHTSITGNQGEKADVYYAREDTFKTTEEVASSILRGINGDVELATENENKEDGSVAIVTAREYCLIYYPEDKEHKIYVQLSDRKYNYTSDNAPYHSKSSTNHWYRSHYYSSGFSADSSKWRNTPSAYTMYDGPVIQDLGNGYFDMYASSVRDSSIGNRGTSGGGLSSGK